MTDTTATDPEQDDERQDDEQGDDKQEAPKTGRYRVPQFNAWPGEEPIYATSLAAWSHWNETLWRRGYPR